MPDDLPFYLYDPLVDQAAHRLLVHTDEVESARRGFRAVFGACLCAEWTTPTWDDNTVVRAYDDHMTAVQLAAHARRASAPVVIGGRTPPDGPHDPPGAGVGGVGAGASERVSGTCEAIEGIWRPAS